MRKLSDVLGSDRWAQVQRSPLKDQIRNCSVSDVTVGEVKIISDFFKYEVVVLVSHLLNPTCNSTRELNFKDLENEFGSEEEWIEGMPIPKRD